MVEWNKVPRKIKNSDSIDVLKKRLLESPKLSPKNIFDIQNPYDIKLLATLRPCLSILY